MKVEVKPENIEQQSLGNLYIVGELNDPEIKDSFLINLLVSLIKKEYYSHPGQSPLKALESSLHQANLALTDFMKQGNLSWIGKLHLTCACLAKKTLHLTHLGEARAMLLRQGRLTDIFQNPANLETFSHIFSGQLKPGDRLILATPSCLNLYSREQLSHLEKIKTNENALILEIPSLEQKTSPSLPFDSLPTGDAPIVSLKKILRKSQNSKLKTQNHNSKLKTIKQYKFPLIISFILALVIFFFIALHKNPPQPEPATLVIPEPIIEDPIEIVETKPIADLSIAISPPQIIKIKNNLYFYNPGNNSIYEFDMEENKIKIAGAASRNIGYFQKATLLGPARNVSRSEANGDEIIFYTDTPGLAIFKPEENRLSQTETVFAFPGQNIIDLGFYSTNIYLLDLKNNQINKHKKILGGFGIGQAWLKEKTDLSGAVSMAIDGSIFILKSDGTVLKYFQGRQVAFELQTLTTPLNEPSKIFTNSQTKNLYILDPNNNRLVVFSKQGDLITQYTSPQLTNLKDVWVEEKASKAYLLNGVEVFEIDI